MKKIIVSDKMQHDYCYSATENEGKNFHELFKPELTPHEMLSLGVFGGKYLTDCQNEFPSFWFEQAKLSKHGKDISLNYFSVDASQ